MRTVKILMMAGALAISTPAFAQFSNASTGSGSVTRDTNPYDRLSISYQYDMHKYDIKGADDQNMNGFAIDYIHGFSISRTYPLFIETGIGLNMGFHSNSSSDFDFGDFDFGDFDFGDYGDSEFTKKTMALSVNVPVNIAYKFNINNNFSIHPYLGLNCKVNVLAKAKTQFDDDDIKDIEIDNFDKKDVGKDGQWKRFQLGWHVGAGINYKAFYAGLSYGTDFMELAKKLKTSTFKVSIGYNF